MRKLHFFNSTVIRNFVFFLSIFFVVILSIFSSPNKTFAYPCAGIGGPGTTDGAGHCIPNQTNPTPPFSASTCVTYSIKNAGNLRFLRYPDTSNGGDAYRITPMSNSGGTTQLLIGENKTITINNQDTPSILQKVRAKFVLKEGAGIADCPFVGDISLFLNGINFTPQAAQIPGPYVPPESYVGRNYYSWNDSVEFAPLYTLFPTDKIDKLISDIDRDKRITMTIDPNFDARYSTADFNNYFSSPMTNCQKISGNGPRKIVFMRGKSWNSNINDYLLLVDDVISNGFKKIDPFKTYADQFSFYVDLEKHDDLAAYSIKDFGDSAYATQTKIKESSSCTPGIGIADQYLFYTEKGDGSAQSDSKGMAIFNVGFPPLPNGVKLTNPIVAVHETAHGFAGLSDEYTYAQSGSLATRISQFIPGATFAKNCTSNPLWDYRSSLDNKVYGGVVYEGCSFLLYSDPGSSAKWPKKYYRPSRGSIMKTEPVEGILQNDKFNVISCGYIVAAIKGEATTKENAQKYWPECKNSLDTTLQDMPSVRVAPTINSVAVPASNKQSYNSAPSVFARIFEGAKLSLRAAVGVSNTISITAGESLSVSGSGFTATDNTAELINTSNPSNIYEVLGLESPDLVSISFAVPTSTPAGSYLLKVGAFNSPWSSVVATLNVATYVAPAIPTVNPYTASASMTAGRSDNTITGTGFSPTGNKVQLILPTPAGKGTKLNTSVSLFDRIKNSLTAAVSLASVTATVTPEGSVWEITDVPSANGTSLTFAIPSGIPAGTYTLKVAALNSGWSAPISIRVSSLVTADVVSQNPIPAPVVVTRPPDIQVSSMSADTVGPPPLPPDNSISDTILLSATASDNPPAIVLHSSSDTKAQKYDIYRKTKDSISWGSIVATVPGTILAYIDTTAVMGSVFEYRVIKTTILGGTEEAYVLAGNKAPLVENRGKVILVVDTTYATDLSFELGRLKDDLEGDGWTVVRLDVNRADNTTSVRTRIKALYDQDQTNTSHVFLFGHVPVPYSGFFSYDGHGNHQGAWPADAYYGDIDGVWTDTFSDENLCIRDHAESYCPTVFNRIVNFPGDGRFDQNQIPSKVELAVGRVDFVDMPEFLPQSEKDLLRQYLNKDHLFRNGGIPVRLDKGGTFDQFSFRHELDTWKDYVTFFGQNGFTSLGNIYTTPTNLPYLWLRTAGGGYPNGMYGGPSTRDIVLNSSQGVFNQMFGSYFGDFGFANDLMRAVIADKSYGLTSTWTGWNEWKFHRMGLGETIGDSTRLSQNIDWVPSPLLVGYVPTSYTAPYKWVSDNRMKKSAAIALMGDPTLRMFTMSPPTNVTFTGQAGSVRISWTAPDDVGIVGYNVYRGSGDSGELALLTNTPVTTTSFVDTGMLSGRSRYMVKAIKLQATGSGSFYNSSQGVIRTVSILAIGNPVSVQDITQTGGGCALGDCPVTGPQKPVPSDIHILPATPNVITVKKGEVFSVTFHYKGGPSANNRGWNPFTFLVSNNDSIVVGASDVEYPITTFTQHTATWSGDDVYETFRFKAPTNSLDVGEYRLITGLYDGADRLPLINETGYQEGTGSYVYGYEVAKVNILEGEDHSSPGRSAISVSGATVSPLGVASIPVGANIAGTAGATISFTTDESATCKYSTVNQTPYASMTSTFTAGNNGRSHSATVSGIPNGGSRTYSARCVDVSGNVNTSDRWVVLSVAQVVAHEPVSVTATADHQSLVQRGSSASVNITFNKISIGAASPITFVVGGHVRQAGPFLTVDPMPQGVSFSFSPESCTPNPTCSTVLTVNTSNSAQIVSNSPLAVNIYSYGDQISVLNHSLTVTEPPKTEQIITFDADQNRQTKMSYGLDSFARSTSGLPITFSVVSGSANIVQNITRNEIEFTSDGDVVIRASQTGNSVYGPATPVERTFHVSKAPVDIIFDEATLTQTYDGQVKEVHSSTNPDGVNTLYQYAVKSAWGTRWVAIPVNAGVYYVRAVAQNPWYDSTEYSELTINKIPQILTTNFTVLSSTPNQVVGGSVALSAVSPATRAVTYTISGTGSAHLSDTNTLVFDSEGTVTVTASHTGDINYLPTAEPNISVTFNVAKITGAIGVTRSMYTFDGNSHDPEISTTFPYVISYADHQTTHTNAGTYPFTAVITDTAHAGTVGGSLVIAKKSQAISFGVIGSGKKVGDQIVLSATSDSGLPVTFTVNDKASLGADLKTLTVVKAGTVEVTAHQGGNGNYEPAVEVTRPFISGKGVAFINFDQTTLLQTYDTHGKTVTYTTTPAGKNVAVTYEPVAPWWDIMGHIFGSPEMTSPTNAWTYTVHAVMNDADYTTEQTATLTIAKANQTITFAPAELNKLVGGTAELSATSPATGDVTFSIANTSTATVERSDNTLTFTSEGFVDVIAHHSSDNNYSSAPDVIVRFIVARNSGTISVGTHIFDYDTHAHSPEIITVPSGLPYTVSYADEQVSHTSVGTYHFIASIIGTTYAGTVEGDLVISRINQTITFSDIVGEKNIGDQFDLSAVSTSNLPVQLTVSGTIGAGSLGGLSSKTLTVNTAGTIIITAVQTGSLNYSPATEVVKTLVIPKTSANITINYPTSVFDGNPRPVTYAIDKPVPATSISVTYNGSLTPPVNAGTYDVILLITDPTYSGSRSGSFTIGKATQNIVFNPVLVKNVGDKVVLTAIGAQGAITFSVVSGTASLNSATREITYTAPGTVKVRATAAQTVNFSENFVERDVVVGCDVTNSVNVGGQCATKICTEDAIITSCSPVSNGTNTGFISKCNSTGTATIAGTCQQSCNNGTTMVNGHCTPFVCTPNAEVACAPVNNGVNSGFVSKCSSDGMSSVPGTCTLTCNTGFVPSGNSCNAVVVPPNTGTKTKAELLEQLNSTTGRALTPAEKAAILEKLKKI